MGLLFPKRLPGEQRPKPRPKPKPKPKPKAVWSLAACCVLLARDSAIGFGALTLLLVLPWP